MPLSSTQLKAINLIANGKTYTMAARELGITDDAIHLWKRENKEFKQALNIAIDSVYLEGLELLRAHNRNSVAKLLEHAGVAQQVDKNGKKKPVEGSRQAAKDAIELGLKAYEKINLVQKIEELEAKLAQYEQKENPPNEDGESEGI